MPLFGIRDETEITDEPEKECWTIRRCEFLGVHLYLAAAALALAAAALAAAALATAALTAVQG